MRLLVHEIEWGVYFSQTLLTGLDSNTIILTFHPSFYIVFSVILITGCISKISKGYKASVVN